MKFFTLSLAVISAGLLAAPAPAAAQRWQSINQRQAHLNHRINLGVRNGTLTRREAYSLRRQFAALNRLEWRYRRSGNRLTSWERRDLNRRFNWLSRQIRYQRHDWQRRR
jgi:hypothetical protein